MIFMSASKARDSFSDTVNRVAYRGERIVLQRRGKAIAALVPVADFERLERLSEEEEDRLDNAAAEAALREKGKEKRRTRLVKRLASLPAEAADLIVIDTPPSASLLLENVLHAVDEVVVPGKLDPLSIPALERTRTLLHDVERERGRPLRLAGVVATFHDMRTKLSPAVLEDLRARFSRVLGPIRIHSGLAHAPSLGQTIFEFDPGSRGAVDYALLAEELGLV